MYGLSMNLFTFVVGAEWKKSQTFEPVLITEFKFISGKNDKARNDMSKIQEKLANKMTNELIDQEREILMNMKK